MAQNKERERQHYIETNKLQDFFIDRVTLYQCRNVVPQRKYVGRTIDNKYQIYFEETPNSLRNRARGKSEVVTSWNIVYTNGLEAKKLTKEFMNTFYIAYSPDYTRERIIFFLENNKKNVNALGNKVGRKIHSLYATDEEFTLVREFLKKLRQMNENK